MSTTQWCETKQADSFYLFVLFSMRRLGFLGSNNNIDIYRISQSIFKRLNQPP